MTRRPRRNGNEDDNFDDERYVPFVGPAADPFEDRPDARRTALQPLLAHDGQLEAPLPRLLRGSGWERLDLVLGLPDPETAVQALAPEEFVLLAKDVGLVDANDLLALASPRQLQACVDLDAWAGDALDVDAFSDWLLVADDAGVIDEFVAAQEDGVLSLYLQQAVRVVHGSEAGDEDDEGQGFESPDGLFRVMAGDDEDHLPIAQKLVEAAYRGSPLRGRALLQAQRWELPAMLAEDLREFRATRLDEMGAADRLVARELYTYADPHERKRQLHAELRGTAPAASDPHDAPRPYLPDTPRLGLLLRDANEPDLLRAAMAALPDADHERVRLALQRLAWRVQSARARRPAAVDELPTWTRHATATVTMGLQHLAGGDPTYAALLLREVPLSDVFSAGHGLVVIEQARARRLRQAVGGSAALPLLEPDDERLVRAMAQGWPGLPAEPEDEPEAQGDHESQGKRESHGEPDTAPAALRTRPVADLAELGKVRARLQALAAVVAWLKRLCDGGDLLRLAQTLAPQCSEGTAIRLQTLFATVLARVVLQRKAEFRPLQLAEVRTLLRTAFVQREPPQSGARPQSDQREVRPELRQALLTTLLARPDLSDDEAGSLADFATATFERLADELGGLDPERVPDARVAGNVLLVARAE
jgi:hypothetical protein